MPRVFLSQAAFDDLLRLEEFLVGSDDPVAVTLLEFILNALHVLTHQPCIGRPVEGGLRELIISRKRSGYLARYEFDESHDLVLVARIRHQRESGYSEVEL
ncbi:MAG: type II toxin-antitoxin system RelE/ParE family toxin [Immundisolibacter sp.]|uniref:type II toxin-antitoxin system RelE/ParE family toxin n=1 Tax=Immundisolibacter sp. TaxID=1934948 RepID=UPI003EDFA81E